MSNTRYTLEEVRKCNGENGTRLWVIVSDEVYDVTDYLSKHPGGRELIEEYAGRDATSAFNDFGHSSDAKKILKRFIVGELVEEDKAANRKKRMTSNIMSEGRKRRTFLRILCGNCAA